MKDSGLQQVRDLLALAGKVEIVASLVGYCQEQLYWKILARFGELAG